MTKITPAAFAADIAHRVLVVRNVRVLLDADLAALYGVSVRRLNEQVRRNADRFPEGFMWSLTDQELANLKSQFATSSWGGRRKRPLVFTEHGAVMAATVLNSAHAVQMTIFVVRAFVKTRELLANHRELAGELDRIKQSIATLDASTRQRFDQVYEAILELMNPAARKQ
jgi:ORF6N domain